MKVGKDHYDVGQDPFRRIRGAAGDYITAEPSDVHDAEALEDSVFFIAHVGGPVIKG